MAGGCYGQTAAPAACQQTVSVQSVAELQAPGRCLHSRTRQRQPKAVSQVSHIWAQALFISPFGLCQWGTAQPHFGDLQPTSACQRVPVSIPRPHQHRCRVLQQFSQPSRLS